jgi:hypothetical protein
LIALGGAIGTGLFLSPSGVLQVGRTVDDPRLRERRLDSCFALSEQSIAIEARAHDVRD